MDLNKQKTQNTDSAHINTDICIEKKILRKQLSTHPPRRNQPFKKKELHHQSLVLVAMITPLPQKL